MKNYIVLFALSVFFISCDKKSEIEKEVEAIPLQLEVVRFDKAFYETPPENITSLKRQFPYFFSSTTPDSVWTNKMKNPLYLELYSEVQKQFSDFSQEKNELEELFKHIKFYFPNSKTPKVITLISEMDYQNKVIYTDSLALISLDLYLGKNHKFYDFPEYLKQNFEPNQIAPDLVSSFAKRKISPPTENDLLSQMIYFGKELYLKDLLLPNATTAEKIGYLPEQEQWCIDNEGYIWRYFIEEKMLYSTDSKLANRFINLAPFSKFYLEIDNESPGRVGTWIGWQIVRSFMANNEISVTDLLQMDAKELFNKSKYKPKK